MTNEAGRVVAHGEPAPGDDSSAPDDVRVVAQSLLDRSAFEELYQRYAHRVFRYALERTGSAVAADDILGDTMVSALEGLVRFDPKRGTFAAWIFTIASRRVSDRRRGAERFRRAVERSPVDRDGDEDALDVLIRRDDVIQLRGALTLLDPVDREVILLRYSAELGTAEIGDVLGLSSGAVRMRLTRARRQLAVELRNMR